MLLGKEVTVCAEYDVRLTGNTFKLVTTVTLSKEFAALERAAQITLYIGLIDSLNSIEFSDAQELNLDEPKKVFSNESASIFPLKTTFSFIQNDENGVIDIDSKQSPDMSLLTPTQNLEVIGSVIDILNKNTKTLLIGLEK